MIKDPEYKHILSIMEYEDTFIDSLKSSNVSTVSKLAMEKINTF